MASTYSFLDTNVTMSGPGGSVNLGAGAAVAKEGITFTATSEINKMDIGADGKGMHSLHADKSGNVVVKLLKTSPMNSALNQMYISQTSSASLHGQNHITLNNPATGDNVTCEGVAFKKAPDLTYAEDGGTNDWEFHAIAITRTLGNGSSLGQL